MNNKNNKLAPEIQEWLVKEIADILTGRSIGGGEDFSLMTAEGMTEITLILVTKPLGDKISKFVEEELRDNTYGVEFTTT